MKKLKVLSSSKFTTIIVILIGLGGRLLILGRGHNYDFDSFMIVAKIVDDGNNVYANTPRYNYGPVWFNVLHLLFRLAAKDELIFRYLLVAFLSSVDLLIFIVLKNKLNRKVACLFFLNPISIIITGYHNQFDNLALLIGMFSILVIGEEFDQPITGRKYLGLLILGLSMTTKHIFFLFPFWLALKQKGFSRKLITVLVPVSVFLFSFVPYWREGYLGIIQNVISYKSFDNAYFYKLFIPDSLQFIFTSRIVWIFLLILFGFVFRKVNSFDSLLYYSCVLVAASPSIANQYLVIVIPFISANLNPFTLSYIIIGTYYLLIDHNGLYVYDKAPDFTRTFSNIFYPALIVLLCLGFVRSVWSLQLSILMNKIKSEIKIQLGYEA